MGERLLSTVIALSIPPWIMALFHDWPLPVVTFAMGVTFGALWVGMASSGVIRRLFDDKDTTP